MSHPCPHCRGQHARRIDVARCGRRPTPAPKSKTSATDRVHTWAAIADWGRALLCARLKHQGKSDFRTEARNRIASIDSAGYIDFANHRFSIY